ncbi:hypothetical protein lerEdw1_014453 [Lerista edwardsae]|nr:hypothetical protein lerEdw1_014453 [Lerista edwardsae]
MGVVEWFNFVGKLLGPRGNSLKRLQEETLTKMSILGKGSMRDKAKEEELRKSGEAKYFHLNDDLHVLIEVFAPPAEAYARMGHALEEIKKFLIPDYNDEIRQAQLQELTYLNGGSENAEVPVIRGKPPLRARGVPAPALARARGGVPPPPTGVPRGAPAPRGIPPSRGPIARGRGLLTPRARGVPPSAGYRPLPPPPAQDTYGDYEYDDGYGTSYDEQSYDSYDNSYGTSAQSMQIRSSAAYQSEPELAKASSSSAVGFNPDCEIVFNAVSEFLLTPGFFLLFSNSGTDYYDYAHGLSDDTYDSYRQEEWTNSRHKAPPPRTTKGAYREQPYARY